MKALEFLGRGVWVALLFALLSAGCSNMPSGQPTRSLVPAEAGCC